MRSVSSTTNVRLLHETLPCGDVRVKQLRNIDYSLSRSPSIPLLTPAKCQKSPNRSRIPYRATKANAPSLAQDMAEQDEKPLLRDASWERPGRRSEASSNISRFAEAHRIIFVRIGRAWSEVYHVASSNGGNIRTGFPFRFTSHYPRSSHLVHRPDTVSHGVYYWGLGSRSNFGCAAASTDRWLFSLCLLRGRSVGL